MSQPGDTTHRLIRVTDPATGAGVTGLTLAGFTVVAKSRAYTAGSWTDFTHGSALVEIGSGIYALAFTLPTAAGWWRYIFTSNAGHIVWSSSWEGELETFDYDAVAALAISVSATISSSVQLGSVVTLETVALRQRELVIPITDQNGVLYANFATDYPSSTLRISVRGIDQTTNKWDAGPSGVISLGGGTAGNFAISSSGSNLLITIPEDAGFFSALPVSTDKVELRWEVTGDYSSAAAKTRPIIRSSPLFVYRREVGT